MTQAAYLREGENTGRLLAPRSIFKATAINHLSYGVQNYAETRDWYMDVFGMDCVYDGDSAWTLTDLNGFRVKVCAETGVYPGAAHDFFHQTRTKK
jgi:hypothetical protein